MRSKRTPVTRRRTNRPAANFPRYFGRGTFDFTLDYVREFERLNHLKETA